MADSKKYNGSTWEHSLRKLTTATDTLTTLPVNIYADGNNATVGISGNTVQSGTPTPSSPVDVSGVGVRTENLFDEIYASHVGSTVIYKPVYVGDGTFTLSSNIPQLQGAGQLFLLSGDVTSGASTGNNDVYNGLTRSVSSTDGYVTIGYRRYSVSAPDVANYNVMLNTGSTTKPYEPWGYKIPISSAGTTTPVYLGEIESTRRIKKLVLTGEENFSNQYGTNLFSVPIQPLGKMNCFNSYCTHYKYNPIQSGLDENTQNGDFALQLQSIQSLLAFKDTAYSSVADFKSYLAAQYANGTPVTVWYVLATPTTGIVNEPLCKIGDYADAVSGITIPTITSKDTFDVDTTLKPSEVSLSYTGWHDATIREWDGSQWNE